MILFELRTETANPSFDARRRSGIKSIKSFAAGERFSLGGAGANLTVNFYNLSEGSTDDTPLITALLANGKPSDPRNYAEVAATSPWTFPPSRVLDKLMETSALSAEHIRTALGDLAADEEDKQREADAAEQAKATAAAAKTPEKTPEKQQAKPDQQKAGDKQKTTA